MPTVVLIGERRVFAMSNPPGGGVESSAGPFRARAASSRPPAHANEADPTERLTSLRQKISQRSRAQRTRRTVDLSPATHRALDIWQREAADRLGLARVTGQEVLTALIDQLLNDPKLSSQVIRSIQNGR
jgi:hypothetical protein